MIFFYVSYENINIFSRSKNEIEKNEFKFFLTGGIGLENTIPKPVSWLLDKSWDELCRLSDIKAFNGLKFVFLEIFH